MMERDRAERLCAAFLGHRPNITDEQLARIEDEHDLLVYLFTETDFLQVNEWARDAVGNVSPLATEPVTSLIDRAPAIRKLVVQRLLEETRAALQSDAGSPESIPDLEWAIAARRAASERLRRA